MVSIGNTLSLPFAADTENDGKGYRKAAEPFDRKPFVVALAATWDKQKLNKAGTDLKPNKSPVKVTIEQVAFTSFKVTVCLLLSSRTGAMGVGCSTSRSVWMPTVRVMLHYEWMPTDCAVLWPEMLQCSGKYSFNAVSDS